MTICRTHEDIQRALDVAQSGDTIEVEIGCEWSPSRLVVDPARIPLGTPVVAIVPVGVARPPCLVKRGLDRAPNVLIYGHRMAPAESPVWELRTVGIGICA